ncbi:MAG TPA: FAD-binding oxidoreductase [Micromonosporaceae bacterium]|nr:FAD-binding oxidoreductase [Micromonosporaceae bacterium]
MSSTPPHGVSGWQRDLAPVAPQPALSGDTEARVVVAGAGLAGLALAYSLVQSVPADEILVIEADRAGSGASGRSTGIVGPGVGGPIQGLVKKYGPELATKMFGASVEGVAAMRRLAKNLPDDSELTDTQQLMVAKVEAHVTRLRESAQAVRELGFDARFLDRAQLAEQLGTDHYHGAICYPDAATINPWRLCQALKSALLAAGVRIAEQTPVTGIEGGDPAVVTAGGYRVHAKTVALTTDGFSREIGVHRSSIAAIRTHVLRTEVLPAELLASTGWNGESAVIDSRSFFNYFRMTPQRRLLFGGGPVMLEQHANPVKIQAVRDRLVRELGEVFPALAGVGIADFWSGVTASTSDRLPIVGPLPGKPGVWFAGAWSGHGLSMSALTAEMLAPRLAGSGEWPDGLGTLPWLRVKAGWAPDSRMGAAVLAGYLSTLDSADRRALRKQAQAQAAN